MLQIQIRKNSLKLLKSIRYTFILIIVDLKTNLLYKTHNRTYLKCLQINKSSGKNQHQIK